jgi:hypothetical protein
MTDDACETPFSDHIAHALERMEAGARMILDAIPDDSSLSSSCHSSEVTKELARLARIGAAVQPSASPDGEYVRVPREPTKEMIGAGFCEGHLNQSASSTFDCVAVYRAMLAALIPAPAKGEKV